MIKQKRDIQRDILAKFKSISDDGHLAIPPLWLQFCYFEKLTVLEQNRFKKAVQELISQGLIQDMGEIFPHLKLTDKGTDLLFF
jgi:hypothetical protein